MVMMFVEVSDLKMGGEREPYRIRIFKDLKLENIFLKKKKTSTSRPVEHCITTEFSIMKHTFQSTKVSPWRPKY